MHPWSPSGGFDRTVGRDFEPPVVTDADLERALEGAEELRGAALTRADSRSAEERGARGDAPAPHDSPSRGGDAWKLTPTSAARSDWGRGSEGRGSTPGSKSEASAAVR